MGLDEFKALKETSKDIVLTMKKDLRTTIFNVQKMEETCSKIRIVKEFIKGLLDIFELYSSFTRNSTSDFIIPYDDIEASEMLLIQFFYKFCLDSNNDFFDFLYSQRTKVLDTLRSRNNKVSFLNQTNSSDEEANSKAFTEEAINKFFPIIRNVTIGLFEDYTQTMRAEEATVKTEALRQSKLKTSVSKDMASILEKEPSLDPKSLQALIDDRITANKKRDSDNDNTSHQNRLSNKEKKAAAHIKKLKADADKKAKAIAIKKATATLKAAAAAKNSKGPHSNSVEPAPAQTS